MKKYTIHFTLMEMAELVYACNHAIDREHKHFLKIFDHNVDAIRTLERTREKFLAAIGEDSYHVELNLSEIIQLYSACNMAWHYEKDEMPHQHECKIPQYRRAIEDLELAREKILAAINK